MEAKLTGQYCSAMSMFCCEFADYGIRSLVHPSANLGLYTIKSTPGLISRHGVIPGSFYHDTPGAVARSIKDVAVMLDIIAGPDHYDNLTFQSLGRHPPHGYTAEVVDKYALKGMKLGLPWNPYWSTWGVSTCCASKPLYMSN